MTQNAVSQVIMTLDGWFEQEGMTCNTTYS